jgi:chlorobactene glucosyltransferase
MVLYTVVVALMDWFSFTRPSGEGTGVTEALPFAGTAPIALPGLTTLRKRLPETFQAYATASPTGNSTGNSTENSTGNSADDIPATGTNPNELPSLSVLIPARNEEKNIAACVESLCAQDYPGRLEILVLDDGSEDRTGEIVAAIAQQDSRVRVIRGGELLPGWKGKPNALRQLKEVATGELLLLTDADCIFYPGALAGAVRHREKVGADCLSLKPYLECGTFWEHVMLPLQYFLVFAMLPIPCVGGTKNAAFAAANGAFLLLPAKTYDALGGHEAVKGEMAEDVKFAQYVKLRGYKLVYGDGTTTYKVRMYDSLNGIYNGFSKNLFPAMDRSLPVLIGWCLFLITTQVVPFLFVGVSVFHQVRTWDSFWFPFWHVMVAMTLRIALTLRFRQALWAVITHPLGWLITMAIAWNSAYLHYSGKGHSWKGRVYQG